MTDPTWLTIRQLVRAYTRRELSAVEVLETTLSRIASTEPRVHAYARVMDESALKAARRADEAVVTGRMLGPLHGVPVAVKDLVHTAGFATEGGSRVLEGFVPSEDAVVVRRLTDAGAIIVGKSVTHEFAYGRSLVDTCNGWDPSCYSGGSSAGSAVALAVGSAHGAIGTDTGGSIRVPAAMNGIVGLKPTYGRVSRRGIIPMSPSLDAVGPMARNVEDCALMLAVIAGAEDSDPSAIPEPVPDYLHGVTSDLTGVRIGLDREYFFYDGVEPHVATAVDTALDCLQETGAEVVPVRIPHIEASVAAGLAVLLGETSELHQERLRRSGDRYLQDTRIMLELGELLPATAYIKAQKVRSLVRDGVRVIFEENSLDTVAAPTIPLTTMPLERWRSTVNHLGETPMGSCLHHGMLANVTGLPSLTLPVGLRGAHPIGMQLIGRPFAEKTLFRIGHVYEQKTSWHRCHPGWLDSD